MKQSLILVGRSGSGKTKVLETLYGTEVRKSRDVQSVERLGSEIQAKETFGFFSNERDLQSCIQDLTSCIHSFSAIDVIGYVIRLGRFTPEEKEMIEIFRDTLGESAFNCTIVIFTHLDNLIYDDVPLSEFLEESPQELQDLLRLCGGRYVAFDNTGSNEDKLGYAKSLAQAMEALRERNKYTTDMLDQARDAKLLKDEEQNKKEEDTVRVLKERMKLDMRAEVEAHVRRELEQPEDSWSGENHDRKGLIEKRYAEDGGKKGLEDRRDQVDLGRKGLEEMRHTEDHGRRGQEDHGMRGLKNRPYTKDQARRGLKDRYDHADHEKRGLEDRRYTEDHGRRGLEDRRYTEDHGRRGQEDMSYLQDKGGKSLVATETKSLSTQGEAAGNQRSNSRSKGPRVAPNPAQKKTEKDTKKDKYKKTNNGMETTEESSSGSSKRPNMMKQSLILVGRSGSGKTRVKETLCGTEVKNARDVQLVEKLGLEIQAKETFGFFSNERDLQSCIQDLTSCIRSFSAIDIIGYVIRLGRFTPEEKEMIEIFRDTLGESAFNFTIVIFTHLDNLIYDDVPLSEFLEESPQELHDLLRLCGGRYVAFDNIGSDEDKLGYARSLAQAMESLQERNKSATYTTDMLDQARAAKLVKDEDKKKIEEDNNRVLKERMKLDMHTEVEAKVRRELEQPKDSWSGEDHDRKGLRERRYAEDGGKKGLEDRRDEVALGSKGLEEMRYTKDHGTRWYTADHGRRGLEDHGRTGLTEREDQGPKTEAKDQAKRGLQVMGYLPGKGGKAFIANETERFSTQGEERGNQRSNSRGERPSVAQKPGQSNDKKAKKEKNKMWVCGTCFENNDNSNSCCLKCGEEKKAPTRNASLRINQKPRPGLEPDTFTEMKREVARIKPIMRNGVDKSELRVVLIGKTGAGKSSTANTILGSPVFTAKASPKSVTEKCSFERRERFGKRILLVDTPGLFDTSASKEDIEKEVKKCIAISAPGPHAFLLVMSLTNRFTEEEKKVLEEINNMFGDQMINYLIVLFTGRDHIDEGTLEQHIYEYPTEFQNIVQNAGGRYIAFNNRGNDSEKEDDVNTLLNRIDEMVKKNGGGHFTSEMFEEAEKVIQQRIANELEAKKEEIRKAVEDEIRKEVEEEMRAKMDAEKSRLEHLHERDLQEYKTLRLKMDMERKQDRADPNNKSLRTALRTVLIQEMRANSEKKLIRQIEECEGPEKAEVHKQLAGAGREIQQLLQKRRAEAEGSSDVFVEEANAAEERYLEKLRDEERDNIQKEVGILQQIKEKIKGIGTGFLNLFS